MAGGYPSFIVLHHVRLPLIKQKKHLLPAGAFQSIPIY